MRLENKIAIVTGAAQGIGRGIALEFAKEGADMMIMDLNGERLAETAKEIEALGRKVETFVGNVADEEAIVGCVNKTIETFGRIDILMHAAGILFSGSIIDLDIKNWQRVIDVNLLSSFLLCKYVGRQMVGQKSGAMILIDSCASKTGEAFNAVYCASKAAVAMLTRVLALELAPNITSVAIQPGNIETDMLRGSFKNRGAAEGKDVSEFYAEMEATIPMGRIGRPEDIAEVVAWLFDDRSAYIDGNAILIAGGKIMA